MNPVAARGPDLATCVRAALAPGSGLPLGRIVPLAAGTFVCVEAADVDATLALRPLVEALEAAGVVRGRITVAAASRPGERVDAAAVRARLVAAAPGIACVVHDPARAHPFVPGHTPGGIAVALDDALLEAEAVIVAVAPARQAWLDFPLAARVLVPGFADTATCRALEDVASRDAALGRAECASASSLVAIDASVTWARDADGTWHVWAAPGDVLDTPVLETAVATATRVRGARS